jgi:hypothetical protein
MAFFPHCGLAICHDSFAITAPTDTQTQWKRKISIPLTITRPAKIA